MFAGAVDIERMNAISRETFGVAFTASPYGREVCRFDGRDENFCHACVERRLNDGITVSGKFGRIEMAVRVDQHIVGHLLFGQPNRISLVSYSCSRVIRTTSGMRRRLRIRVAR